MFGFKDKKNSALITALTYDMAYNFNDGLAKVVRDGKAGFIDTTGQEVIPLTFPYISSFSDERARFEATNGKWGFVDRQGKVAIVPVYDLATSFSEGLAMVEKNGRKGFINKKGINVIALVNDEITFSQKD